MVPFYGWGSTASGSQSYYDEAVYFLPPCSRNSSEWWKAGLMNLEPRSGFEHRNPTTIIEWYASAQFSCQNENFVNTSKVGTLEKYRSCHQRCSMKKAATLLKRRLWHRCFRVNFVKFLTTPFSQNTSGWLFSKIEITMVLIAGFNPGQTWVLFSYGFSKTQLTWIKPTSSPLPNLAGSFKKSKKPVLARFAGFVAKANKTYRAGFTVGSRTQLTQVTWVQEPSLPSLAGFIKKLDFSWVHLNK